MSTKPIKVEDLVNVREHLIYIRRFSLEYAIDYGKEEEIIQNLDILIKLHLSPPMLVRYTK